jgi:hypothetical protein
MLTYHRRNTDSILNRAAWSINQSCILVSCANFNPPKSQHLATGSVARAKIRRDLPIFERQFLSYRLGP